MEHAESKRIHLDWWGKCRTCRHWAGPRRDVAKAARDAFYQNTHDYPRCTNEQSPLYWKLVGGGGHCEEWDSFDVDVALEIMEESESLSSKQGDK